jgi:predicted Zn-ribbon and HTH transcriptional regulator
MLNSGKQINSSNIGVTVPGKKLYVCMDCQHRWTAGSWFQPSRCPECGGKSVAPDPLNSIILWQAPI